MFGAYLVMALMEMRAEKKVVKTKQEKEAGNNPGHKVVKIEESLPEKGPSKEMIKAVLAFCARHSRNIFGSRSIHTFS